jgi:glycosyltransferase involved in cell wall biosynthesis
MILLEAMAAGVPIVASSVGGIPEAIEHDLNGSLVKPLHPRELAEEMARVLSSPEVLARYKREGRRAFDERFSAEAMTRRYEELYLRDMGRASGR